MSEMSTKLLAGLYDLYSNKV